MPSIYKMLLFLITFLLSYYSYGSAKVLEDTSSAGAADITSSAGAADMPKGIRKTVAHKTKVLATEPYVTVKGNKESKQRGWKQIREDAKFQTEATPYGPVFQHTECGADEEPIGFIHPFALLYYLCEHSEVFYRFLKTNHTNSDGSAKEGRLCIYADETTPGNVHRPDKGRQYMAVYWTLLDFPNWFRSGPAGWLPFAFIDHEALASLAAGLSSFITFVLHVFFGGICCPEGTSYTLNTTGIRLCRGQASLEGEAFQGFVSSEAFLFKACFACFLGDGKAHQEITLNKGPSGTKPCPKCQNVIGRIDEKDVPQASPVVHYTCPDPERFVPHTNATIRAILEELRSKKRQISDKRLYKKEEQLLGFTLEESGLLASEMMELSNVPESIYFDWMHSIFASGGIGQYELNQFLLRIQAINPNWLSQIERYDAEIITWPKATAYHKLSLEDRLRKKPNKHIKMFANECMTWILIVGVWAEVRLLPDGLLEAEVHCFFLLVRILYLLSKESKTFERLELLEALLLQHHREFFALYPEACKIKAHWVLHIAKSIALFRVNLSCFAPERLHKFTKHIAAFCFKNMPDTLVVRSLRALGEVVAAAETFEPFVLISPGPLPSSFLPLLQQYGIADRAVQAQLVIQGFLPPAALSAPLISFTLRSPVGTLQSKDLLLWKSGSGLCAGFAFAFVSQGAHILIIIQQLQRVVAKSFVNTMSPHILLNAKLVLGAFPYIRGEDLKVFVICSDDIL